MGPHTFNFLEAAQAAENSGAALRVANMEKAIEVACELVLNAHHQTELSNKAMQFAHSHGGATRRTALAVREVLDQIKGSAGR
jgi:3-deoxy-D-manno-octulosonic-acid transferase